MATKDELKSLAQSIRRAAVTDPTFFPVRLEMKRLADKLQALSPVEAPDSYDHKWEGKYNETTDRLVKVGV